MKAQFEALYEERRNAIPSWQGYHFQGMVSLLCFLKKMVNKYGTAGGEEDVKKLKLRIEWLEDFILYENGVIKEIYQIKKTLTQKNRKEVLENFIVQFKFLDKDNVKWILGYNEIDLSKSDITKTEYEEIYKDYIEDKWLKQIDLLQKNYKDKAYWKKNLDLTNKASECKAIRAYVRKLLDLNKKEYTEEDKRREIGINYLEPLKKKLQKKKDDYEKFKNSLEFMQFKTDDVNNHCKQEIRKLFVYITERNNLMTEQDILDKLYADIYEKMMSMERKEEMEDFKYELSDIKKVFLDEDNSIFRWKAGLYREQERLLDEIEEEICKICSDKKVHCSKCILNTIKEWDMYKIVDNLNLEYAPFIASSAEESCNNKLSDYKRHALIDMMENFKIKMSLVNKEILEINQRYVASAVIGGKRHNKHNIKGILDNYWKHSQIYRDYENVLTSNYNHVLTEKEMSFLKSGDEQHVPLFNEVRNTKFLDYEGVKL